MLGSDPGPTSAPLVGPEVPSHSYTLTHCTRSSHTLYCSHHFSPQAVVGDGGGSAEERDRGEGASARTWSSTKCTRRNVHASENPLCVHIPFSPRLPMASQAPPAPAFTAATLWDRRRAARYVCLRSRPPWVVPSLSGAMLCLFPPFPPFVGGLLRHVGEVPLLPSLVVYYERGCRHGISCCAREIPSPHLRSHK